MKSSLPVALLFGCLSALAGEQAAEWSVAVARRPSDGWHIVSRYLDRPIASSEKAQLPVAVTVRWRYESANGMPKATSDAMYELEDFLEARLANGAALLVLVQTGNNSKSWTFFARSEGDFRARIQLASGTPAKFPVEVIATPDLEWRALEQFRRGVRTK